MIIILIIAETGDDDFTYLWKLNGLDRKTKLKYKIFIF